MQSAQYDYSPLEAFYHEMVAFETSPSEDCPVFYSCEMLSGPTDFDICSLPEEDELSFVHFDQWSGNYEFSSQQRDRFPLGTYTFEITGTIAKDLSASVYFEMIIVDPCLSASITLYEENAFHGMIYVLRDPPQS